MTNMWNENDNYSLILTLTPYASLRGRLHLKLTFTAFRKFKIRRLHATGSQLSLQTRLGLL